MSYIVKTLSSLAAAAVFLFGNYSSAATVDFSTGSVIASDGISLSNFTSIENGGMVLPQYNVWPDLASLPTITLDQSYNSFHAVFLKGTADTWGFIQTYGPGGNTAISYSVRDTNKFVSFDMRYLPSFNKLQFGVFNDNNAWGRLASISFSNDVAPVPEPTTSVMMLVACVFMVGTKLLKRSS